MEASYPREEDRPIVIHLYGRTKDGQSITVLYEGFYPYFHLVEPSPEAIMKLERMPHFIKREPVTLWYDGKDRECQKVIVKFPYEVPDFRRRMQDGRAPWPFWSWAKIWTHW